MQLERLIQLARQHLSTPAGAVNDPWLREHSERVMRLTAYVAALPELAGAKPDVTALAAAGLYHDAGWAIEYAQGRLKPWQMLARPTSDLQRELGASLLLEQAAHLLPGPSARKAAEAIRQCNVRKTTLLEARILADAEALDELSTVYVFRQYRQYEAEGRPLQQIVQSWQRQKEYRYWDLRLQDGFHFGTVRELAGQRLATVEAFITALARDLHGDDLRQYIAERDAAPPVA